MSYGIFHAYGLFWRLDEVNWYPGQGYRNEFRLLGRIGANKPGLRVADFREQQGIYILYGNYGPHYAGLTRRQTFGKRLKDHLNDSHGGKWDRFSWFSFRQVLKRTDDEGLQDFGDMPTVRSADPDRVMGDIEALLIKAMALNNVAQMNFAHAEEWTQIGVDETQYYLDKASAR